MLITSSSVVRAVERALQLGAPLAQPPAGDLLEGLGGDGAAHLGVAAFAFDELDGHLLDHQPRLKRAPGHVGLEDVTGRLDGVEVDLLQGRTAEQAVARGGVPDRDPEQQPDVQVAEDREELAEQRPVDDRAALDPARPDDQVGRLEAGQQQVKLLRLVGAVGVHLAHDVVPSGEGLAEAVQVRRPQAGLLGAVHHADLRVGRGQPVRDVAGAVGAVVVDDHHVDVGLCGAEPADDPLDVEGLVEGRDDHHDAAERGVAHVGTSVSSVWSAGTVPARGTVSLGRSGSMSSSLARLLRRRYGTSAMTNAPSETRTDSRPSQGPKRTPGVVPSYSLMSSTMMLWVRGAAWSTTLPSGAMTPEMPLVAATTTYLPLSIARSRLIAHC